MGVVRYGLGGSHDGLDASRLIDIEGATNDDAEEPRPDDTDDRDRQVNTSRRLLLEVGQGSGLVP
jgi:hypothetical protein